MEEDILDEIQSISRVNHNSRCGLSHQRCQKFKALQTDNELLKIAYLVDSHTPTLRERAAMRYQRISKREELKESRNHLEMLQDIVSTKCDFNPQDDIDKIRKQVAEMPKEWTIVQLSSKYNPLEQINLEVKRYETNGLHLLVFNCGQSSVDPIVVTVDPPSLAGNKLELLQNLMNILNENNERLLKTAKKKFFKDHKEKYEYMSKTEDTELALRGIVQKIEENWLREWRCLLIGKYQDDLVEQNIRLELDIILTERLNGTSVSPRSKELLYQITKGAAYLNRIEILRAVKYCLSNISDQTVINDIANLIKEVNVKIINNYDKLLRHPIILVVDECLDSIPWEMIDVLNGQPISRVPSLHFIYLLFKAHENEIVGGHKVIQNYENGKYVVNPDGDLAQMEMRMIAFYNYWLPKWNGIKNRRPTKEEFNEFLKDADIFSYSGHGNGTHIMTIEMLQNIKVKAVVLLFGCASTRISRLGTQVEMYGSYHMYLIARCPCVLGMLWPVTDVYTDILTTEFLSGWIPSVAPIPWANVNKNQWKKSRKCDTFSVSDKTHDKIFTHAELSRALWHSKNLTGHYLTQAACVVRGLPVKIKLP